MIPCWIKRSDNTWGPGWLIQATKGNVDTKLMVAYDDKPAPNWKVPPGSLCVGFKYDHEVRIRRSVIPVLP